MKLKSYQETKAIVEAIPHESKSGYTSCSSLPALEKCSKFKNRENSSSEASLKGSILHYILENNLNGLVVSNFTAKPDDFPDAEWSKLMFIVSQVSEMMTEGWVVHEQEDFHFDDELKICGTIDLVLKHEKMGIFAIMDFKTGYVIVETTSAQIGGYGHLVMQKEGVDSVYGGIIQENNYMEPVEIHRESNTERIKSILSSEKVEVNDNCQYCQHLAFCPQVNNLQSMFMKKEVGIDNLKELRDAVPTLEARIKEIKKLANENVDILEGYTERSRSTKSVNKMAIRELIDEVGLDKLIEDQAIEVKVTKTEVPEKYITISTTKFAAKAKVKK